VQACWDQRPAVHVAVRRGRGGVGGMGGSNAASASGRGADVVAHRVARPFLGPCQWGQLAFGRGRGTSVRAQSLRRVTAYGWGSG
jgi:hypothetical protein